MNGFEPTEDMIGIEDVAHALSQTPRFGGHLPRFYSVAQHSVMCSHLVDLPFMLDALLHDAAEAYLTDMPRPIKQRLPEYKKIEDNLMQVIARKFAFAYQLADAVKKVDEQMLQIEWNNIMLRSDDIKLSSWNPEEAEQKFLQRFEYANKARK